MSYIDFNVCIYIRSKPTTEFKFLAAARVQLILKQIKQVFTLERSDMNVNWTKLTNKLIGWQYSFQTTNKVKVCLTHRFCRFSITAHV